MSQRNLFPKKKFTRRRALKGVDTQSRQRSMEFLRKAGYRCESVEFKKMHFAPERGRQNAWRILGSHTNDLFGFMDLLAYAIGAPVLAVQACRRGEIKEHLDKFRGDSEVRDNIKAWLGAGCAFVIHGWEAADRPTKDGKGTVRRWEVKEVRVRMEDLLIEDRPF